MARNAAGGGASFIVRMPKVAQPGRADDPDLELQ